MTAPASGRTRRAGRGAAAVGVAVLTAIGLAAGCTAGESPVASPTTSGPGGDPVVLADLELASSLQPFDACDDLLAYVKDQASQRVTAYGLSGGSGYGDLALATDAAERAPGGPPTSAAPSGRLEGESSSASDTSSSAGGVAGTDYSATNVQEEGVDEPDTIKSDARRILAIADNRLQYVDVTGETPVVTGALDLPDAASAQLLVAGDRVLVISESGWSGYDDVIANRGVGGSSYPYPGEADPEVTLTLVDAADPANLRVLTSVRLDGSSVSARMVDGRARIVTTASPTALPFVYPSGPSGEDTALETNRRIIDESTLDDWLPHVHTGTATDDGDAGEVAVACENVRHPKTFAGFDVLTIQTVDLEGEQISTSDATAIMANGQTVYASAQNLYVATPSYVESPDFAATTSPNGTAPAGTAVPGTVPGTAPERPSTTVADPDQDETIRPWEPPKEATTIHRFGIGDDGPAVYRASGEVAGSLLNQFSMSEHEDRLRVATTTSWSGNGSSAPASAVRVLEERDGELVEVGSVDGLGKGEQIKSVRFIGDRGYVVTFRQTDPLFTIDLSDPTAPVVAGELKILGYSAYLHPAGDGLLIGIGQDATEQGRATGTQLSLFDVSDAANPRQIQKHLVGVGSSAAEQDHHAFLWWPQTNLAMIPVQNYDEGWYLQGAMGYTVTPDGITEVGFVSHPTSFDATTGGEGGVAVPPTTAGCDPVACGPVPPLPCPTDGRCDPSGSTTVAIDRALVIGDRVYTVSATGVLASRIDDLEAIGGVDFDR